MAALRKKLRSPYWFACFTLPGGRRVQRSTKLTDRRLAMKTAVAWEEAARNRSTESQIRTVFSDIHRLVHGRSLASATVHDYAAQWLARKRGEVSKATIAAYKRAVDDLLEYLGERQHADLGAVTAAEVAAVRDRWAVAGSPKTTNNKLKALRVLFQDAWRAGLVLENVAAKVPALRNEQSTRRAFTLEELKKVLGAADGEWRGMALAGLYTGQRLGDLARLRWNQVDLVRREIALTTAKTARRVIVPIAEPLLQWLQDHAGDDATGPVFPSLAGKRERGGSSPLSQEFYEILVAAGLATERAGKNEPTGKGRRARRERSELSFHALRHTATSWLKAAGVSEAIARDIIGHDSAAVSRHYTHTNSADKAAAVARLPDVLGT